MKKKQRVFFMGENPVVVVKESDYAQVTIYGYNRPMEISITKEWKLGKEVEEQTVDKKELADVKKIIEALEEIVEHAEKW